MNKKTYKKTNTADIRKMLELRNNGATISNIADVTKCPRSTVHYILKDIQSMTGTSVKVDEYRRQQADVMDTIAAAYSARLLDDDAIKGASALQAASVMGIAVDKSRLIKGQSSANIQIASFFQAVQNSVEEQ